MPATGTPEPGGLLWDETLNIIRIAAKNSNIVGADINELSPIKGFNSYNFLVAKLAYKILSYKFLLFVVTKPPSPRAFKFLSGCAEKAEMSPKDPACFFLK